MSAAADARSALIDESHDSALRLFNGFYEGFPDLVVDLYARTLVLQDYTSYPHSPPSAITAVLETLIGKFPWIRAAVLKTRHAITEQDRRGKLVLGENTDQRVQENGVWYAIDLLMNQDTSLYLDTRNLRIWARENLCDKRVLNAFAYTGSYGVAALAGRASQVVQTDANRRFLDLAKVSYSLNGFPIQNKHFLVGDFWTWVSRLKRSGDLFDCIFLDPPYFVQTNRGTVDMLNRSDRMINKTRPLIMDGGYLIAINNALFLSGREYLQALDVLCADGYLALETLIPVPPDITGYPHTSVTPPPVDPTPFNHPTKIAVLRSRRKKSCKGLGQFTEQGWV